MIGQNQILSFEILAVPEVRLSEDGKHNLQRRISVRRSQMNRLRIVVLLALAMLIAFGSVYADGGKTGVENAKAKTIAIKKAKAGAAEKGTDSAASRKKLAVIKKKLYAAVKAGKLTKDQAAAKWKAITMGKAGATEKGTDSAASKKKLAAIKKKLFAAVKAGKLTAEQAKAKWVAITKSKNGK